MGTVTRREIKTCARCGYPVDRLVHVLGCIQSQDADIVGIVDDLVECVRHILTVHSLWSPDGSYTFPDGTTFYRR